jgi:hypothetical protein
MGLQFTPDFLWAKNRGNANSHQLYDVLRGVTKALNTDTTSAEVTLAELTSFDSGGVTLGTWDNRMNGPYTYVDWLWKANGAGVTNTSGTITSTVSANQTAGFSIVTYTGTGANATVGHGLGVVPKMVIVKNRTTGYSYSWNVYHASLGATQIINLDLTGAAGTLSTAWNDTAPTTTVFSIGTLLSNNRSTNTYVAYCFAEIAGYSKFGSYTGNGSTDGPFVFCGFRPRYILFKNASASGDWQIKDTARAPYNVTNANLYANLANLENSAGDIDVTATGFKVRSVGTDVNGNTNNIIYADFSEMPTGGSNVAPAPAR